MNRTCLLVSLKKLVIFFAAGCCLLVFAPIALADQFVWISLEEAKSAVEILKDQKEIKHFCAPCNDKKIVIEEIKTLKIAHLKGDDWQVEINGSGIDLAYVYFKTKQEKWKNLALELKLDAEDVPEFLRDGGAGRD